MGTAYLIGREVKSVCRQSQKDDKGDCVESLISLLDDETSSFKTRNSAIWALGQLGDNRALPVLQKYYTGNIPSSESFENTLSQYELKKAINLTSGGLNITSVFWR